MTKKERERYHMNLLMKKAFNTLTLDPNDYERPDFHLTHQERTIGLELTMLQDPDETLTDTTGTDLEEQLNQRRNTITNQDHDHRFNHITVTPHPRDAGKKQRYWPPKKDHETFTNDLLQLLQNQATGKEQTITIPKDHPTLNSIDYIDIMPTGQATVRWQLPPQVRFVSISTELLANRINEKKRLAATYDRTGLDELWLAIIPGPWHDTLNPDEWQELLTSITDGNPTPFDRIIITNPNDPDHPILADIP